MSPSSLSNAQPPRRPLRQTTLFSSPQKSPLDDLDDQIEDSEDELSLPSRTHGASFASANLLASSARTTSSLNAIEEDDASQPSKPSPTFGNSRTSISYLLQAARISSKRSSHKDSYAKDSDDDSGNHENDRSIDEESDQGEEDEEGDAAIEDDEEDDAAIEEDEGDDTAIEDESTQVPLESQAPRGNEDLEEPKIIDNVFAIAARESNETLLRLIYDQEVGQRPAMRHMSFENFATAGHAIIATMHTQVLVELMGGNLPRAAYLDRVLDTTLWAMRSRSASRHPGIYARYLVDAKGNSPTPKELRLATEHLLGYLGGTLPESDIVKIESQVGNYNSRANRKFGGLRYLSRDIKNGDYRVKRGRGEAIKTFAKALVDRLDGLDPALEDEPLPTPLVYIGYALNCNERNKQHDKHVASNFLMDLFEAICLFLFGRYRMRWHVVVLLYAPEHVAGGEIIVSAFTQGYHTSGWGFAHHSAGETTDTHELKTNKKGTETGISPQRWEQHLRWIERNTPLIENIRAEVERFKASLKQHEDNLLAIETSKKARADALFEHLVNDGGDIKESFDFHANAKQVCSELHRLDHSLQLCLPGPTDCIEEPDPTDETDDETESAVA